MTKLKDEDMMSCPCGCSSFDIYHTGEQTKIFVQCQRCFSIRRIISPGVQVDKYDFSLPLVSSNDTDKEQTKKGER